MNYQQAEVELNVSLVGSQAIRGSYSHYHRVEKDGKETDGIRLERAPLFCDSFKIVHLSNEFVIGALEEAPKHYNMKPHVWKHIHEEKRIAIHVAAYVKAVHPEHRGYKMAIR